MNWLCTALKVWAWCAITGPATIHDGDTMRVQNGQTSIAVRLFGIDAEELHEPHGKLATDELRAIVGHAIVSCRQVGLSHARTVAACTLPDGTDIGAEMVRRGAALDCARYSGGRYRELEPDGARARLMQKPYC